MAPDLPEIPATNDSGAYGTPEGIVSVLHRVRAALTDLFVSAGFDPTSARATARELGLSKDLVWRVARITVSDDMSTLSTQIPPRATVERVTKAIRDRGVAPQVVRNVQEAMLEFEQMVEVCAGDRTTFEMLLSGLTPDHITERQEGARKQAYLASSTIWGVQAKVTFKSFIMAPCLENQDYIDMAHLAGLIGFRRLRQVAWPVYREQSFDDTGARYTPPRETIEPIPEEAEGLPLLSEFCSEPLPEFTRHATEIGWDYEIAPGPIGNAGASTWVFGNIFRCTAGRYQEENNKRGGVILDLFTPVENAVVDLFVHKDLDFRMPPEVEIFDRMTNPRGYTPGVDERRQLPHSGKVLSLGRGTAGCTTHLIPRYPRMLDRVLGRLGWSSGDFTGYRVALRYPPIPTAIILRFDLLERPS